MGSGLMRLELDDLLLTHLRVLLLRLLRNHTRSHDIGTARIVGHLGSSADSFGRLIPLQVLVALLIGQPLPVFLILLSVIVVLDHFLGNI